MMLSCFNLSQVRFNGQPEGNYHLPAPFQSLIGTVQRHTMLKSLRNTGMFQSLIGTVQRYKLSDGLLGLAGGCFNLSQVRFNMDLIVFAETFGLQKSVSISHRYGSTTVFTAFSVFIIPHFPCFSTFFSKKVGQPLHCRFSQSLDFTVLEVHRLFYRIFNNLLFECPTLNFYRKPKIQMQSIAAFISSV